MFKSLLDLNLDLTFFMANIMCLYLPRGGLLSVLLLKMGSGIFPKNNKLQPATKILVFKIFKFLQSINLFNPLSVFVFVKCYYMAISCAVLLTGDFYSYYFFLFFSLICGDLGINCKTPNRILTRQLPDTKCINASPRIRLHASIRLKSEKKIIKSKVANGKRSR